jgi:hypothetical protein
VAANDGAAGNASATSVITGTGNVSSIVSTIGGASRSTAGSSIAYSIVTAPHASSVASATDIGTEAAGGACIALSNAYGTSGTSLAEASTSLLAVPGAPPVAVGSLSAVVQTTVDGEARATTFLEYGQNMAAIASDTPPDDTGAVDLDALPIAKLTNQVLAGNAAIKTAFGKAPSFFAAALMGGGHAYAGTDAETTTATATVGINLADLTTHGQLVLGLYNGDLVNGSGVTGVTLSATGGGVTFPTETFTSGAAALAGFSDKAFDLGALGTTGVLDLTVTLAVTTNAAGSYFFGNFLLGDPPGGGTALQSVVPESPAWIASHG